MPRYYDPERSDLTVVFIKKLQSIYSRVQTAIPEQDLLKATKSFLADPYYDQMANEYISNQKTFPDIVLKSNCQAGHFIFNEKNYGN